MKKPCFLLKNVSPRALNSLKNCLSSRELSGCNFTIVHLDESCQFNINGKSWGQQGEETASAKARRPNICHFYGECSTVCSFYDFIRSQHRVERFKINGPKWSQLKTTALDNNRACSFINFFAHCSENCRRPEESCQELFPLSSLW